MTCGFRDYDYGIDLTIHEIVKRGAVYGESGFHVNVQARSTTGTVSGTHFPFDLDVRTYDNLRDPDVGSPRMLVLVVFPPTEAAWVEQSDMWLRIYGRGYWMSLTGAKSSPNRRSVRVAVPVQQTFTAASLRAIMDRVRKGGLAK